MTYNAAASISPQTFRLACFAIVLLAFVLRIWGLGDPSLWFDEAVYVLNSSGSLADTISETRHNNSSPVFLPLVLFALNQTVGLSEFTARFPSVIASTGAVIVMLLLPRAGVDRRVALGAGFLLALGQMQIMYAQEVREYAFSILISAMLVWSVLFALNKRRYAPLAIVAAITPWVSYGPAFVVLAALSAFGLIWLMDRKKVSLPGVALCGVSFFASAALAYQLFARHQLGTSQQWYLIEHYLGASGMNPVSWLAQNTAGVFLASMPGLLCVIVAPLLISVFLITHVRKPIDVVAQPSIVLAIILTLGMVAAGVIEVYPFGSPRHSVFFGPVFTLATASAFFALLDARAKSVQKMAMIGAGLFVAVSASFALSGVLPFANAHPTLQKVANVRVYGEYEDNRALVKWAREHGALRLYGSPGAVPGLNFYGADLDYFAAPRELYQKPELLAQDILRFSEGEPVAFVMANIGDGEAVQLRAALTAKGATVTEVFEATRVVGFVVNP